MVKRELWQTSQEGAFCAVAERIPKIARTGNLKEDNRQQMLRDSYVKVVDGLWKEPQHILAMAAYLDQLRQGEKHTEKRATPKNTTIRTIDEVWIAGFLKDALHWQQQDLELIKAAEPDALRHLLIFGLGAALPTKVPDECRGQQVLAAALKMRLKAAGARLANIGGFAQFADASGTVDWKQHGVFRLNWNGAKVESVAHRPTGDQAVIPAHVNITDQFVLLSNWDDNQAKVEFLPSRYNVASLFDEGKGAHKQLRS